MMIITEFVFKCSIERLSQVNQLELRTVYQIGPFTRAGRPSPYRVYRRRSATTSPLETVPAGCEHAQ